MELDLNDTFHIGFDWLDRDHGDPVDRATFAQVEIVANGECATRVEDVSARTVRPYVRVAAYPLALWLAANWWRLRWEPQEARYGQGQRLDWRLSHDAASIGEGYLWPDLRVTSEGATVRLDGHPTRRTPAEPVRYLDRFTTRIDGSAFEQGIDRFVEAVLERIAGTVALRTPLADLWKELREERLDPEAAAWRRLEAKLGFDPDEAPATLVEGLMALSGKTGLAATEEVAVASKERALVDLSALWAFEADATAVSIPHVDVLRAAVGSQGSAPPWKRAVDLAHMARRIWEVPPGPLMTPDLAGLLSFPERVLAGHVRNESIPMPAGFRDRDDSERVDVLLMRPHSTERRFSLARLVGDHLYASGDHLLPATDARTERQQFQRAFAQEILCPFQDLVKYLGDEDHSEENIEEAAHDFDVSPLLVERTLRNNWYLDRSSR